MSVLGFIVSIIIAIIIGIVADKLIPFDMPGGWLGSMIAGFAGAWVGHGLFGQWGPDVAGFALIPALLGAIIVIALVGFLFRAVGRNT